MQKGHTKNYTRGGVPLRVTSINTLSNIILLTADMSRINNINYNRIKSVKAYLYIGIIWRVFMGEKIVASIAMTAIIIMLPYILTMAMNGREIESGDEIGRLDTGRDILIQIDGTNVLMDVEQYIAGILPGIVDYSSDASFMEAQAVAVRTKIYYAMGNKSIIDASELDFKYYTMKDYMEKWGNNKYKQVKKKYDNAVINTARQIIE